MQRIPSAKTMVAGVIACGLMVLGLRLSAGAQQPTLQDPLLDRMVGKWLLSGEIVGKPTTHDVDATWALNHQFVHIHETSREKTAAGLPQYEANVFLGWDMKRNEYVVHWMDVFGGGFSGMGYADKKENTIPVIFKSPEGDFHTTFTFDKEKDRWLWTMDNEQAGKLRPFARLTMVKANPTPSGK